MLNGLDLFSGIGGLSIALSEWVRPIAYCEIDAYCQGVLLSRMAQSVLSNAPIWDDIRTLGGKRLPHTFPIEIIYGGFPCQDISVAGHGKGLEGERSGLVFEMLRLAKEIQPKFLFFENVPAITSRGGLQLVRAIAEMGYDCRWCVIPAAAVGAPHRRERWWLLAHSASVRREQGAGEGIHPERSPGVYAQSGDDSGPYERRPFTNTNGERFSKRESPRPGSPISSHAASDCPYSYWQETEPPVCGVDDGPPYRVDRIRALGNGVVIQQAKEAFETLMGLK